MKLGIIKEGGEIKGYKTPAFDYEKERFAKNELRAKSEKEQMKYADHALSLRAKWLIESDGYGDSSCNIKEGDRMPASSRIPKGCEIPEVVAKAKAVIDYMLGFKEIEGDKTTEGARSRHREYAYILNCVYLYRKENETIMDTLERFGYSKKQYLNARKRFAQLLSLK